ncbi:hypothetical protein Tsubulata_025122 [Turnera subulata]|uniref:Large ribosomal subunit protein bL12 C-terminal domain-containing protein n=1 Tax=Turnera subulata TaxID=218843 RepID=A0A9Q0G3M0_9ROSI|nr:hypothetical protein Tsubulata_025122 [Turnera subulata]
MGSIKTLTRLFATAHKPTAVSRSLSTATESRTQKLELIADELLDLSKLERYDYMVLFNHKLGLNRFAPVGAGPILSGSGGAGSGSADAKPAAAAAAEKKTFDVKLEKFDAAAKLKIVKEIRGFTDLGLKEAKDLVEKAPVVVKKGLTKEEANSIVEKFKALGATAVLE